MKIAFTGVFDLENYGDHIFPIIFKAECDQRSIDAEIYLFSCFENKFVFGEEKNVYPMEKLEMMHEQIHFDLVVIGGGEIIHYYQFNHQMNGDTVLYPMFKVWVIPSFICHKHGIPLVWNNPGIPFRIEPVFHEITEQVLSYPAYLSVRNPFSLSCIEEYGLKKEVYCNPDTAFLIHQVYEAGELLEVKSRILSKDNYIIFHGSSLLKKEDMHQVISALKKLKSSGYEIVLMPLAYTNKDDTFLKNLNTMAGDAFYVFERKLTVKEIVSVFHSCIAYVGFSFHGAITAFSFDKPVIAFDYTHNKKTEDLFQLLDASEYYLNTSENLYESVLHSIQNRKDNTIVMNKISNQLDKHFNYIFNLEKSYEHDNQNIWESMSAFIGNSSDLLNQCKGNSFEFMLKEEEYRRTIEKMQRRIDELEKIKSENKLKKMIKYFQICKNNRLR